ncbi:hypothetical protein LSTR_LSTR000683 [Laodelphax striatellus]|uniref:Uncharacterized protein n=1 Tax=Laodelphax striatellus TaxID=195883 RepID=A0A482XHC5_LAOST|nr:hypothetical protein LSTR_LSTR000683 [Laodelphax striatellus]
MAVVCVRAGVWGTCVPRGLVVLAQTSNAAAAASSHMRGPKCTFSGFLSIHLRPQHKSPPSSFLSVSEISEAEKTQIGIATPFLAKKSRLAAVLAN